MNLKPPVICEFCDIEYPYMGIGTHRKFCKLNPNAEVKKNTVKGQKRSDETREKNRQSALKQHADGKGSTPPNWKGKTHSAESKAKIAQSMRGNRNGRGRGKRCDRIWLYF